MLWGGGPSAVVGAIHAMHGSIRGPSIAKYRDRMNVVLPVVATDA